MEHHSEFVPSSRLEDSTLDVSLFPHDTATHGDGIPSLNDAFAHRSLPSLNTSALDAPTPPAIDPSTLPVRLAQKELEDLLQTNDIVVITSETGSGKTTQIPQILAEKGLSVLVTQPRRVTTQSAAQRVAEEMGVELGTKVGFAHGLERCFTHETKVLFCTDGYELVRELASGQSARHYDVLVLDEIHEMNSNMILLLALAREYVQENPGSKLLVMSATMNAEKVSEYLGAAPILTIPGRTFGVTDVTPRASMEVEIADCIARGEEVLVFLPGKREIQEMGENLGRMGVAAAIVPFHGELPSTELAKALEKRTLPRIILATNIGQTGITPSVHTVIDSGLERRVCQVSGTEALDVTAISQYDVAQRRGRAGRDMPGNYLYCGATPIEELQPEPTPDLLRTSIEQLTLRLLHEGRPIERMQLLHQPSEEQVLASYRTLGELGLISRRGKDHGVTKLGQQVVKLPVDVRAGIMISHALEREAEYAGITREIIDIVAVLETRSLIDPRMEREWKKLTKGEDRSDLLAQLAVFRAAEGKEPWWYGHNGIKERQIERAVAVRQMLLDRLNLSEAQEGPKSISPNHWEAEYRRQVLECVWHGLIDCAFKRVRSGWTNGNGIRQLPRDSVVHEGGFVVGVPFGIGTGSTPEESSIRQMIFLASQVDPEWYRKHSGHLSMDKQRLAFGLTAQSHEDRKIEDHDGQRSRRQGKHGGRREHYDRRGRR